MLKNIVPHHKEVTAKLSNIAPSGYTMALNVCYLTPQVQVTTYPETWVKRYREMHFVSHDPVAIWSTVNSGTTRWSDLPLWAHTGLSQHVIEEGRQYGLVYGASVARRNDKSPILRCVLFAARPDREMTDLEIGYLADVLDQAMTGIGINSGLSEVELETLRDLGAGLSHRQIASIREISIQTVRKRIDRAKAILGARNAMHAVRIAARLGLLDAPAML